MIRALIFDFNGVIADDETPHFRCFQQALLEHGLSLTAEEYYGTYLGMDERTCTGLLLTARDGHCDDERLRRITDRKIELFRARTARSKPPLFPGIVEFVKAVPPATRMAIASGGRRQQIDAALLDTAIAHDFEAIVSADDCDRGKPDPAIYRLTLDRLNERRGERPALGPHECLVVEDSRAGIQSAHSAGMPVVGLATTYRADDLGEADLVLLSLNGISPETLFHSLARYPGASRSA